MDHAAFKDAKDLICAEGGNEAGPVGIYLPGVQGDCTPLVRARPLLREGARLIEVNYPRRTDWRLEDFARAVARLLDARGLSGAHILAESFGSLVGWQFAFMYPERVRSLILVGGFTRTPNLYRVLAARWGLFALPSLAFEAGVNTYIHYRRRNWKETYNVSELYPAVRTPAGRRAAVARLALIQGTSFRSKLEKARFPVRYIGGGRDAMVPVRREIAVLEDRLPAEADFRWRLIEEAPHVVVASHARTTSGQLLSWMKEIERRD